MVTFLRMIVLVVGKGTIRMVWTNQPVKEKRIHITNIVVDFIGITIIP